MRGKKGKKHLQEPQKKTDSAEAGESSALATASFIEGLEQVNGVPLHSTALEEDLASADEEQVQRKLKKQAEKRREKENKKKRKKSTPQKSKKTGPATNEAKVKKAAKRKNSGDADAARPVKKQKVKEKKKTPAPESEEIRDPQPQELSEVEASPQSHRGEFSSDEELEESWKPSPKKQKGLSTKQIRTSPNHKPRKSSSGGENQPDKVREKKRLKRSGVTEAEVVLDEFLDFCAQYKASVESRAVEQALDCFVSNVEDQLTEKICSSKRLKTVMRENSKLATAIREKRQRLLDAKKELIKSERQLWLLQKDKSELEQKLNDLNQSKSFIKNLGELNRRYLQHRRKHPDEKETYGASSLPALLIEAKRIQTTELQLKQINDRLQKAVKQN
ncbi:hypothetical protein WMY93_009286 [Mugilogobius chulae]|uniref:Centromere protein U n=1 Tax=Mugilogobius chulae TaxID=88201 RepID=A0AAW0PB48_9GOBI